MYKLLLQESYLWFGYYRLVCLYWVFLLYLGKQLQLRIQNKLMLFYFKHNNLQSIPPMFTQLTLNLRLL